MAVMTILRTQWMINLNTRTYHSFFQTHSLIGEVSSLLKFSNVRMEYDNMTNNWDSIYFSYVLKHNSSYDNGRLTMYKIYDNSIIFLSTEDGFVETD